MGQSGSMVSMEPHDLSHRYEIKPVSPPISHPTVEISPIETHLSDLTLELPDDCLASIFQSLGPSDRKTCSTICRRWLVIEGESRHRLYLNAQSDLIPAIPSLFARFDSVTKLALKCDRRSNSINDEALILISLKCRKLKALKLQSCREITDAGVEEFSKNCGNLRKISIGNCNFGARGVNAILDNCLLVQFSLKRLRGLAETDRIGPGAAASSLGVICLKELYNGHCFEQLITASKSLRKLKLFRCTGNWDLILQRMVENKTGQLVEMHLERVHVSDAGLNSLSNYEDLEILHLVRTPECTNAGLLSIAEKCRLLRKLHIDGCRANRIGDEGLMAVAKNCGSLRELVVIGVNLTHLSLSMLGANCRNLERLALCRSETVGDAEISCIAAKCVALRRLCLKDCAVSDHGLKALACGCPNLVKLKVKKCRAVTCEAAEWLKAARGELAVNLDGGESERQDEAGGGGDGVVDDGVGHPAVRWSYFRSRLGRTLGAACSIRRWSGINSLNKED